MFQIMQFTGYARQLKQLDNVAYLLLISFSAHHISLAFISFIHFNDVEHIFIKINLCLFASYYVRCCFIVPLYPNLSV